ncbi:acyltransferase family protein [Enterobacter mori]
MFFVLSGFVLTWAHKDGIRKGYYKNRMIRIYPAYLFMGLLTIPFLFGMEYNKIIASLILFLTASQSWFPESFSVWNFGGSWSVSTEFFFYLCFPAFFKFIKLRPLAITILALIISSLIFPISASINENSSGIFPNLYISPIHRLPEFVFGMGLGMLFTKTEGFKYFATLLLAFIAPVIVLLFAAPLNNKAFIANNLLIVPSTGILIWAFATIKINEKFLTNIFVYLGKSSYSFYLMQLPIMLYLDKNKSNFDHYSWETMWIIIFFLNCILTIVCYELIEKRYSSIINKKNIFRNA